MLEESDDAALDLIKLLPAAPDDLTPLQRRIASFYRVHLLVPDYTVYCGLTDAMNEETAESIQQAVVRHRRSGGGGLFITSDPDSLALITTDGDIRVKC